MSDIKCDCQLTPKCLLLPILVVSFTFALQFAFQTTQIIRDRGLLHELKGQQEKSFEDSQRLQAQLNALLVGTQQLADQGNKNAKAITDKLKEAGIVVAPPAQQAPAAGAVSTAPVPAATEKSAPGPVKP